MLIYNSVPTTCTANMITGFDFSYVDHTTLPTKQAKIDMLRRTRTILSDIEKSGWKLDFDCLFSIVTDSQYKNVKLFMDKIGMKEVYEGHKNNEKSRHKSTGHLHMFVGHPETIKSETEKFIKEIEDTIAELDPPMVADPDRAKYPEMVLQNFYGHGLIKSKVQDTHRIRTGISSAQGSMDKFKALLSMKFGTDFSDEDQKFLGVPLEEASFGMLTSAHQRWKAEKVILLSDLKARTKK